MGYNGAPPPDKAGALPLSPKTREVLDHLETMQQSDDKADAEDLLRALYEPALAVAAAVNLVRAGNAGMAPFIGAGGVVLSQALEPLVEHFGDTEVTFEEAFERIGVPVVRFNDLPDEPEVETPAADEE